MKKPLTAKKSSAIQKQREALQAKLAALALKEKEEAVLAKQEEAKAKLLTKNRDRIVAIANKHFEAGFADMEGFKAELTAILSAKEKSSVEVKPVEVVQSEIPGPSATIEEEPVSEIPIEA